MECNRALIEIGKRSNYKVCNERCIKINLIMCVQNRLSAAHEQRNYSVVIYLPFSFITDRHWNSWKRSTHIAQHIIGSCYAYHPYLIREWT